MNADRVTKLIERRSIIELESKKARKLLHLAAYHILRAFALPRKSSGHSVNFQRVDFHGLARPYAEAITALPTATRDKKLRMLAPEQIAQSESSFPANSFFHLEQWKL